MNSDPFKDFGATFIGALLLALTVIVLMLSIVAAPFVGAGAAIFYWYYRQRNSPAAKEREAKERTEALYAQARAIASPDTDRHADRLFDALQEPARGVAAELYKMEGVEPPAPPPPICDSIEGARYRDQLIRYINTNHDHRRTDDFVEALIECLPRYPESNGIFAAKEALSNKELQRLITPFYRHEDYFRDLKKVLDRNLEDQRGVLPEGYKGDNCAYAYLKNTPLLDLEKRHFLIGLTARFEHTQIIAGSGSGKTSLIEYMIHHDLADDCCVIVIDSQRQLIDRLAHRDIDPADVAYFSPHHNLGINLFDMKAQGEEEVIAVVDLLEYVLSSLMDAELTTKQATLFNYAVHLLMTVKGANLALLRQLLRRNGLEAFQAHLGKLPPTVRDFFENEFSQQGYTSTKDEIMWRVDAMQRNPAFARIFGAPSNPIDMAKEMAGRRLILVDTDVNHLGDKGSSLFGRFFIALILKAARQRFTGKHRPVYLYIDECAAYLDSRLELMLQQARKANIGVILAHQDLEKARSTGILSTILGNTATKFAGRLSDADARVMAANMNTSAEFLKSLPRYHFAMSTVGQNTIAVTANTRVLQSVEQTPDHDRLIKVMNGRYGYVPAPAAPRSEPRRSAPQREKVTGEEIRPSKKL